jgi:hypothetical protein
MTDAEARADLRPFEPTDAEARNVGALRGRYEGCVRERAALRAEVVRLLDQRDVLIKLLMQLREEREALRAGR